MNRRVVVVLLGLLGLTAVRQVCLAAATTSQTHPSTAPVINDRCPVMPEQAASSEFALIYRGVTVQFCCDKCRSKFDRDPEPYLAHLRNLPPAPASVVRQSTLPQSPPSRVGQFLNTLLIGVEPFAERWRTVMFVLLGVLVINMIAGRLVQKDGHGSALEDPSTVRQRSVLIRAPRGLALILARRSTVVVLVAGILVGHLLGPASVGPNSGAGRYPGPPGDLPPERKFQSQMVRQRQLQGEQFVTGLEKTYWRGNDDRSPKLYQGGIYCTCRMHVRLQTADGQAVKPGDDVMGKRLFVRVEIERAANTLQIHFDDADLTRTFLLSRDVDPKQPHGDHTAACMFNIVQPGQRWEAVCDVGEVHDAGRPFTGMVVVVPATAPSRNPEMSWPAAFYGIQYELQLDGKSGGAVVSPSSKLWMAATYFTEELPDNRVYEWLSWKPLPEIPDGFVHNGEYD